MLMVNTYFHRKRGIAQGIVASGSGVGMMAIAPMLEYLLNIYAWRGTVLLCAGLFLQLCFLSLLLRPFKESGNNETCLNGEYLNGNIMNPNSLVDVKEKEFYINNVSNENIHCRQMVKETTKEQNDLKKLFPFQRKLDHESTYSLPLNINGVGVNERSPYLSMQCVHQQRAPITRKQNYDSDRNMFQRKDIFFSASTNLLTKYESRCSMQAKYENEDINSDSDVLDYRTKSKVCFLDCENTIANVCKPSVLKNKAFIILSLGCLLTQMAQFIPMVFLADYGLQIGLERQEVSVLFVAFGTFIEEL